jgi:hypothetical protein
MVMDADSLEDLVEERKALKSFHSLNLGSNFYSWLEDRRKKKEIVKSHRELVRKGLVEEGFPRKLSFLLSKLSKPNRPGAWKIFSYFGAHYIGDLPERYVRAYSRVTGTGKRYVTLASIVGDFVYSPLTLGVLEGYKHLFSPVVGEEVSYSVFGGLQYVRVAQPFVRYYFWHFRDVHIPSFSLFYSTPNSIFAGVTSFGYDAYLKWKEKTNLNKDRFLSMDVVEKDQA